MFRHFPNKEAIWQAVMEWVAERLLERVESAARGIDSPLEALEAMFMAHVDFVAKHPGVPRMMFRELQRAADTPAKRLVRTLIGRYRERLRAVIEKGQAQGEVAPQIDAVALATLMVFAMFGLHVIGGSAYEMRTVVAMTIRSLLWVVIAVIAMCVLAKGQRAA